MCSSLLCRSTGLLGCGSLEDIFCYPRLSSVFLLSHVFYGSILLVCVWLWGSSKQLLPRFWRTSFSEWSQAYTALKLNSCLKLEQAKTGSSGVGAALNLEKRIEELSVLMLEKWACFCLAAGEAVLA